jgi:hypothetical protein
MQLHAAEDVVTDEGAAEGNLAGLDFVADLPRKPLQVDPHDAELHDAAGGAAD